MSEEIKDILLEIRDEISRFVDLFDTYTRGMKPKIMEEAEPEPVNEETKDTYVTEESKITLRTPVVYNGKEFTNLKSCKYGCGNWVSFDHFDKNSTEWNRPVHFTKALKPIGRGCPKYE